MKLGIIFKKEFQNGIYGAKVEIHGDEITLKRETDYKFNEVLRVKKDGKFVEAFLVSRIQLIYLGGWNK